MTLKVKARLQAFSSAIRRTFVQHFTRFQLTARSRGPSATAGLLVLYHNKIILAWLWFFHGLFYAVTGICRKRLLLMLRAVIYIFVLQIDSYQHSFFWDTFETVAHEK